MIANLIRRARTERGLNQSELARLIGVSPQAVQRWERGLAAPRSTHWPALCRALEKTPGYFRSHAATIYTAPPNTSAISGSMDLETTRTLLRSIAPAVLAVAIRYLAAPKLAPEAERDVLRALDRREIDGWIAATADHVAAATIAGAALALSQDLHTMAFDTGAALDVVIKWARLVALRSPATVRGAYPWIENIAAPGE